MLVNRMGIDAEIADYFANKRPVPANNRFWAQKLIYLSAGFGTLTIPFAFDLMFKAGIPRQALLDDAHVSLMEEGFDRLKRYEAEEISFETFLQLCIELLEGRIKQPHLAADLMAFFTNRPTQWFTFETTHRSLARSDGFLFTLTDLSLSDAWVRDFLPYWYALARPILLFDDFKDLNDDRATGQENTIIELGNDAAAIQKAHALGTADLNKLHELNPMLARHMQALLDNCLNFVHIRAELEQA
jgi:hypothetical protein